MGTLCIYLNFKLIWPNSAKPRGVVVDGAYPRGDIYEEGWRGRSDLLFHVCKYCMVEQCVVLMSSKIFFKVVQLIGKRWCIFLSDFGIDHFYIK